MSSLHSSLQIQRDIHVVSNESTSAMGASDASVIAPGVHAPRPKRGLQFWMCFVVMMMTTFLMALDFAGLSTALPVVVQDLHGVEFEWVGSAYALASTAFLPLSSGLAQVFGRCVIMLLQILFFAIGSAICGAAPNLNVLIVGRTIQGVGAGGIASLCQIILGDLVPLKKRGAFNGLTIIVAYGLAIVMAPVIGGALATSGQWHWFFYMNLPICLIAAVFGVAFLNLKTPRGTLKEKLSKLDWIGNGIVMASMVSTVLALTWGGITHPWGSANILVPLCLGLVGLVAFVAYEVKYAKYPLVPFSVISTRTACSGHLQTFFAMFYVIAIIYYLPVYFQGCKSASPVRAGVDVFGYAYVLIPFLSAAGISITKLGLCRPQLWFSWVLCIVGASLLSTVHADSRSALAIGYASISGAGNGILLSSTVFPVLAPLPVSLNAVALAFYMFVRYFSQVWGVTVGGAFLQNELRRHLPADFVARFPQGTAIAYSVIPVIHELDEPLKSEVRNALAQSLRSVWVLLAVVGALGLLSSMLMRGLPLHINLDESWGLEEDRDARLKEGTMESAEVMAVSDK